MVTRDAPDARPSVKLAALSPTALANVIASAAMLACFLFTLSESGDGSNELHPTLPATAIVRSGGSHDSVALLYLWPFLFAFCTLLITAALVILRPPWYQRALLSLPICFAIALTVGWVLMLFSDTDDSRSAMLVAALVAPPGTLVALRMMWLWRNGNATAAAAWGQGFLCVLAIFSLRWFWVMPIDRMLLGGWLAMVSSGLMMVASWTWSKRARHDLYDRSSPSLPMQISLRQIAVAITVTAIALTYWITFAGAS